MIIHILGIKQRSLNEKAPPFILPTSTIYWFVLLAVMLAIFSLYYYLMTKITLAKDKYSFLDPLGKLNLIESSSEL